MKLQAKIKIMESSSLLDKKLCKFFAWSYTHQGRIRTPFPHPEKTYFVASQKLTDNVIHSFAPHPDTHMPTCTRTNTCTGWATQLGWKSSSAHEKKVTKPPRRKLYLWCEKGCLREIPFPLNISHTCVQVYVCVSPTQDCTLSQMAARRIIYGGAVRLSISINGDPTGFFGVLAKLS